MLSGLSYDLHPLSCLLGPANHVISYDEHTQKVTIEPSDFLISIQKAFGIVAVIFTMALMELVIGFAYLNYDVIKLMKQEIPGCNQQQVKIDGEQYSKTTAAAVNGRNSNEDNKPKT